MVGRSMRAGRGLLAGVGLALIGAGWVPAAEAPGKFKAYTVDVGTGLGVYLEFPREGQPPVRVVYDTGKGAGKGVENDLVAFLTAPEIGLKPASGDFEGDVIDYFVLSHPHEDHFNGGAPLFESFDVRNVVESKQLSAAKYLSRFKVPGVAEIAKAKAAGKDAHWYVVGLPYPNGFDQPRGGKPYDEYALAASLLPDFLKKKIDPRKHSGKVRWPFGPAQVAQTVAWPLEKLLGGKAKATKAGADAAALEGTLEVDVIPVGTRFDLDRKTGAGFTVLHGDTIAALDPERNDDESYRKGWPYYREADLNDGSVSIQVTYGAASVFIPGDTEGREAKPTKAISLEQLFGSSKESDSYGKEEVLAYLRRDQPEDKQLPILPLASPYLIGSEDLRRLAYHSYVTYDLLTPAAFAVKLGKSDHEVPAVSFGSPADVPESLIYWDRRNQVEREHLHKSWRERLFRLHRTLVENGQKRAALKGRFSGWVKGSKPRLKYSEELARFLPDFERPVWTITNLVQLTEMIFYVDPYLAHLLAGFILRSDLFLEYLAPPAQEDWSKRGEKHMLDVAAMIKQESGTDVLKSDVLFFGHHGSFTSSSLGFVLAVDPNVGIISADDKSYSGSTLPDFSAMFWNLNSHHPRSRAILHSLFFHADLLAARRGEVPDEYSVKNRFSPSAARVFKARRRWPIPIWRTDWNDDLVDDNTLVDNLVIESDGKAPIWGWVRAKRTDPGFVEKIPADAAGLEDLPKYQYWFQLLGFMPKGGEAVRPTDPTGQIRSFPVGDPVARAKAKPPAEEEDEAEDWTHQDE